MGRNVVWMHVMQSLYPSEGDVAPLRAFNNSIPTIQLLKQQEMLPLSDNIHN